MIALHPSPLALGTLLSLGGCLIDGPAENDTEDPNILVTVGPRTVTSEDPPPGTDIPCVELSAGPATVTVVATDGGGLARLYIHLIEGDLIESTLEVDPEFPEITTALTVGDNVLNEGDDEITITLSPRDDGSVRTGVSAMFDVEGDTRYAVQTLATDYAGNDTITWPLLFHVVPTHGPCEP